MIKIQSCFREAALNYYICNKIKMLFSIGYLSCYNLAFFYQDPELFFSCWEEQPSRRELLTRRSERHRSCHTQMVDRCQHGVHVELENKSGQRYFGIAGRAHRAREVRVLAKTGNPVRSRPYRRVQSQVHSVPSPLTVRIYRFNGLIDLIP